MATPPHALRVGVTLPTFRDDAAALDTAARAEVLGLDGVFVFDHQWPLGQPERPAISSFPLLGAVAARTERVALGPLVARVGLVPDGLLVAELASLAHIAPGRVVAGIGTGDSMSAPENRAFGIPFAAAADRRVSLGRCARALAAIGLPVWVGAGAEATVAVAVAAGAAVNLWGASPAEVAGLVGRCEVTWAGPVPDDAASIAAHLEAMARAGATWVVCAWPASLEAVADAAASWSDR
jgi:alkanesulfonate monooxygenase SsuD/methylene tetrahydromethanopterin reductase-like flavin-dependent oxidoreductase (luciferase family)